MAEWDASWDWNTTTVVPFWNIKMLIIIVH